MRDNENNNLPSQNDFWEVSHAAGVVTSYACSVSARHIKSGTLRLQFNREVAYYMRGIVRDVESGKRTVAEGFKAIWRERNDILKQSTIKGGQAIGLVAGVLQVKGGIGLCSRGWLPCIPGTIMIAHGANNVYENGKNLLQNRTDARGPIRYFYQKLAGTETSGNIRYGQMDMLLTGATLLYLYKKPGAFRLFKYMRSDFLRGYETASKSSLVIDGVSTGFTLHGINEEIKKDKNHE